MVVVGLFGNSLPPQLSEIGFRNSGIDFGKVLQRQTLMFQEFPEQFPNAFISLERIFSGVPARGGLLEFFPDFIDFQGDRTNQTLLFRNLKNHVLLVLNVADPGNIFQKIGGGGFRVGMNGNGHFQSVDGLGQIFDPALSGNRIAVLEDIFPPIQIDASVVVIAFLIDFAPCHFHSCCHWSSLVPTASQYSILK